MEMKFFAGLKTHEVAALLEVSASTVTRELKMAKHWLARQMKRSEKK